MELLIIVGNYFLWALFSLISGTIGGFGLAAGFDGYKKTKAWIAKREEDKKNNSYLSGLEEEFIAAATRI